MKAMLVYNPVAGQYDIHDELDEVRVFLQDQGWRVVLRETLGAGDATRYARHAVAEHYDIVVAVGGDGTVGGVANGLAFSEVRLGVLPVGTGNVWAHMMELPVWTPMQPSALLEAAQVLIEGEERLIDLGKVGDRYFVLWSGIGFDAAVAKGIEPHREIRRNLGNLPYYVAIVTMGLRLRGTRATIVIDGKAIRERVLMVLVTNAQFYGGAVRLAPQAQLDDGKLDVYVFKGDHLIDALLHILVVLLGKQFHDPKTEIYRGREIVVRADKPLPLHLDGEPAGNSPLRITVEPRAMRVIVPRWVDPSLFGQVPLGINQESSWGQRILEQIEQETSRWMEEYEHLRGLWEEQRLNLPPADYKEQGALR